MCKKLLEGSAKYNTTTIRSSQRTDNNYAVHTFKDKNNCIEQKLKQNKNNSGFRTSMTQGKFKYIELCHVIKSNLRKKNKRTGIKIRLANLGRNTSMCLLNTFGMV